MAGRGPAAGLRRRAPALALLALAALPALALYWTTPRPEPARTAAPAEPPPDTATAEPAAGEAAPAPEAGAIPPTPPAASVAPAPSPSAAARAAAPKPPDRWAGLIVCPREKITGRQYTRCLYDNTRTSEQAVEAEMANAVAVIDARTDLPGVQRAKWKSLLDEAQSRFLLFRNFDCQSVAPFEGPRGIGNFEQRALCLIEANNRRAAELKARYGSPLPVPEGAKGPHDRGGTWTFAVPPPVD